MNQRKPQQASLNFTDESGHPWEQPGLAIPSMSLSLDIEAPYDRVALRKAAHKVTRQCVHIMRSVKLLMTLSDKGVEMPDIAAALGVPAPASIFRKAKAHKVKPGSDAALIMGFIKKAGPKGLSEDEIVEKLKNAGRLQHAKNPRRNVHWQLTNIQKRARSVDRDVATKNWRPATKPGSRQVLDLIGDDRLSSTTPAPVSTVRAEDAPATSLSSEVPYTNI